MTGVAFVVTVLLIAALSGCWITKTRSGHDPVSALENGLIQKPVKNASGWVHWELAPK